MKVDEEIADVWSRELKSRFPNRIHEVAFKNGKGFYVRIAPEFKGDEWTEQFVGLSISDARQGIRSVFGVRV